LASLPVGVEVYVGMNDQPLPWFNFWLGMAMVTSSQTLATAHSSPTTGRMMPRIFGPTSAQRMSSLFGIAGAACFCLFVLRMHLNDQRQLQPAADALDRRLTVVAVEPGSLPWAAAREPAMVLGHAFRRALSAVAAWDVMRPLVVVSMRDWPWVTC
jgi:hypothetical protein